MIFSDVLACYKQMRGDQKGPLTHGVPYRVFIEWLQKQDLRKAEAYWRKKLEGFDIPTQIGMRNLQAGSGSLKTRRIKKQLTRDLTERLRTYAREHRLTVNTLVQGAWAMLLSRYSGQEDIVYGVVVSGRPGELMGVEKIVGLFVNTLPLRVKVRAERPVLEWLRQLQTDQLEMRKYEYSPLVEVQGWSQVPRGAPLFESLLAFENYPVEETLKEAIAELKISKSYFQEKTNYPLVLAIGMGTELFGELTYDGRQFSDEMIEQMLPHWERLLEGVVKEAGMRIGELEILSKEERRQILEEWNGSVVEYPKEKCVHELFEEQAGRTPDAIALVFEGQQLSYRELNERANRLAHYLRKRGVGPEVRVGICVERGLEMVVGLLGILKAGGAYVPLDPQYPKDAVGLYVGRFGGGGAFDAGRGDQTTAGAWSWDGISG